MCCAFFRRILNGALFFVKSLFLILDNRPDTFWALFSVLRFYFSFSSLGLPTCFVDLTFSVFPTKGLFAKNSTLRACGHVHLES